MVERRIKAARFPTTKSLDTFDFLSMPSRTRLWFWSWHDASTSSAPTTSSLSATVAPARTHIALGLGLAACQRGLSVGFTTAAALVHELIEARDERRLLNQAAPLVGWELPEEFGVDRGVAAVAGVSDGQARKEGVRAGAQTDGELPAGRSPRRRTRRHSTRGCELRCCQAPGAVQDRSSTA